jgi:hypothetical protein
MLASLLLAALLFQTPQAPQKQPELGIIAGGVVAPDNTTIKQPLQVVLMPPPYAMLWNQKLQEQLDLYWERYKPAFLQKKELFFEVSKMAYQDTLQFVMARMSRDLGGSMKDYRIDSSPAGKFEFKNLPLGDYKVVAYGRAGDQTYFWQESVEVTSAVPQFVQMKKHVP